MEQKHKLRLRCPVVVEGKYDKIRLANIVETPILVLNGFSVFRDEQKKALLKRICAESGLILFADSDRAGALIRARLKGVLTEGTVYQVYAPQLEGKEKRKKKNSADGFLGIEGIDGTLLYELLVPFVSEADVPVGAGVTRAMWYADGFSGSDGAAERRRRLARALLLPDNLSSGALLEAINLSVSAETYQRVKQTL